MRGTRRSHWDFMEIASDWQLFRAWLTGQTMCTRWEQRGLPVGMELEIVGRPVMPAAAPDSTPAAPMLTAGAHSPLLILSAGTRTLADVLRALRRRRVVRQGWGTVAALLATGCLTWLAVRVARRYARLRREQQSASQALEARRQHGQQAQSEQAQSQQALGQQAQSQQPLARQDSTSRRCTVCFDAEREVAFVPCGHICCCEACANLLVHTALSQRQCPVCRTVLRHALRVYSA